ncbi:hypothetical protein Z042_23655 [Chania multitudinisentens RB-25]|uniref:Uncharacterized protein n=1 Tax=Chania multitudinisentens RB-25 TaxID=1441930 RepID=W0LLT0_9GAMM|nr:hypothetical protein [Chania multitudinisentens]AHG23010.1 hypothetical protein Z042_23655 [Chania multitudinisentens RB-25]
MATKGARPVQEIYQFSPVESEIIPEGIEHWDNEKFYIVMSEKGAVVDVSNMRQTQSINKENLKYPVKIDVVSQYEGSYLRFKYGNGTYI